MSSPILGDISYIPSKNEIATGHFPSKKGDEKVGNHIIFHNFFLETMTCMETAAPTTSYAGM